MCGIAGFVGAFHARLLHAMNAAIAHRGPDDADAIVLEPPHQAKVGLAHRRLSIIDLSAAGRQPMSITCECCGTSLTSPAYERLWLIYNGEIYNYRTLRANLEQRGHHFHSATDSEVLLHLYIEAGPDLLRSLNGIFSFALYDGRKVGQAHGMQPGDVLLARDGIGIKPLYYAVTPSGVLFASELKALVRSPEITRDLDPVALHHYLAYLWAPAPRTPLRGVQKCKPGEAVIVRQGRIARQWTYYDLPYGQPLLEGTEDEIAEELRAQLESAVKRQMVADVPVGAFLSGGLDSSAVVAMMRRARPDYVPTCYSIGFAGDAEIDGVPADLPYAKRVAEHLGVNLHPIEVQPTIIQDLERTLYYMDEPQADPAPINTLLIAEQARKDGTKVLLSGTGGDDLFAGYRRHLALKIERMWGWLPQVIRSGMVQLAAGAGRHQRIWQLMGQPAWGRRLAKAFAYADLPPDDRLITYFFWSGEQVRRSLYSAELAAELADVDTAEPLRESLRRIPAERDPLNRMLYLEAKHFLADHNLNYTDKTGMAAGVEIRVPLFDLELVNFATRIPPAMKQKGKIGKAIFKRAMEPYLPPDIIYRPKTGFGAPLRSWLHQELRSMIGDVLSPTSLRRHGLFNPAAVQHLITWDREGRIDGAYTIFAILCIELWCSLFLVSPVQA
jgi:asparagine synthase (glutamine-hydrolysing)